MFFRTINEGGRGTSEGKANHLFKLARMIFSPKGIVFCFLFFWFFFQMKNPKGPVHTGVVSNNIHGADKSVLGLDVSRWRKREEDKLPGFSLCKRKRFPPADEGKGPFNNFSLHGGCCQTRWGSLRCLPPATSRNKWSKPAPFQANFFPVRLEPAGRRGVVSPDRSSPWLGAGGRWVYAMDNFLVSVLTSTHTREGTGAASQGAPGRGASLRRSRRGRRAAGEAATAAGRRERAGGGSSGIHFLRHISDI